MGRFVPPGKFLCTLQGCLLSTFYWRINIQTLSVPSINCIQHVLVVNGNPAELRSIQMKQSIFLLPVKIFHIAFRVTHVHGKSFINSFMLSTHTLLLEPKLIYRQLLFHLNLNTGLTTKMKLWCDSWVTELIFGFRLSTFSNISGFSWLRFEICKS